MRTELKVGVLVDCKPLRRQLYNSAELLQLALSCGGKNSVKYNWILTASATKSNGLLLVRHRYPLK